MSKPYLDGLRRELSYYETQGKNDRAAAVKAEIARVEKLLAETVAADTTTVDDVILTSSETADEDTADAADPETEPGTEVQPRRRRRN